VVLTNADKAVAFKALVANTPERARSVDTCGMYITAAIVHQTLIVV